MSDREIKLYKFDRLSARKTVLQVFVYYPFAETFKGPYCLNWFNVKRKDISKLKKQFKQNMIFELKSIDHLPIV